EGTTDKKMAIKFLASAYNAGINSGFHNSLPTTANLPCAGFPGTSSYVCEVLNVVNTIEAASTCGSGRPIYDSNITLTDLQHFFFGDTGTPPTVAGGGLLMHFNLTTAQKNSLWTDVQCAFNALAPHWGGGHISYRYDFLTILRVAKQYLDLAMPIPTSGEFTNWVAAHSTSASACSST